MKQQNKRHSQMLFRIDVKIGERIVTLNVNEGDTIEELLIKHRMGNPSSSQKLNQLKQKIKLNIQKQMEIKLYSNQVELANKMKVFLQKQTQIPQTFNKQFQRIHNRIVHKGLSSETPFKQLLANTINQVKHQSKMDYFESNNEILSQNQQKNDPSELQSVLKQVPFKSNKNKEASSKHSISINSKNKSRTYKQNSSQQKVSSKKVDQDLIKAYEVIWKKSKDKTMRQMAQNTLKQLNALPQEGKINEFVSIDESSQYISKVAYTEVDQSIKDFTPIQKEEKFAILNEEQLQRDNFSQSRSFLRRNYRYSYLEESSDLYHSYQRAEKSKEKYTYNNCFDKSYIQILNKDYDKVAFQNQHHNVPLNRRYNYLEK